MKGLQIPERFTGTVYITAYSDPTSGLYGMLSATPYDPAGSDDRIVVGSIEIDIPLDVKNTIDKQVEQLETSKRRILGEASEKAMQINEAIESLRAIEYQGSES